MANMKNKILFISATHGDEGFSIDVLDAIEKKYPRREYGYGRIIGNPRALKNNTRYIEVDLNRSAPGDINSNVYEEKRAAEIMKIANKFKFVVDLHGAISRSGVVIIISRPSLINIIFSGMFSIKKVVIWYTKNCLENGPLTEFCDKPGLEIECGPKNDPKIQNELKKILEQFLINSKDLNMENTIQNLRNKEFYVIYDRKLGDGKELNDFVEAKEGREKFYPFMTNQYEGIECYKMRKVNIEELFLALTKI